MRVETRIKHIEKPIKQILLGIRVLEQLKDSDPDQAKSPPEPDTEFQNSGF
jgi:hypothetical protein